LAANREFRMIGRHKGVNMKKLIFLFLSVMLLGMSHQSLRAGTAEDNALAPAAENTKVKCPKKVAVVLETIKPGTFFEYQYYPLQAMPGSVALKSQVDGMLAEVKIGEGSMVFTGQEILTIETISAEELTRLETEVASKKKIWTNRLNWKEKSARAIEVAEKSYNEAVALLEEKKASSRQTMQAPATGNVHFIQDLGSSVAVDAVLLEIVNPGRMIYTLSLSGLENETFSIGQNFDGQAENFQGQAEVIAVNDEMVTFAVDNTENLLKQDTAFSLKKLKAEHAEAITVPSQAIFQDSLGDYVYVAEKKRAKKIYVTRGASEAGITRVENNLAAGMLLVVSGFDCLAHDKKLRIVNQEQMDKEKAAALARQKEEKAKADKKAKTEKKKKAEKKTEPKVEPQAEPQLPGIDEFIAYLEANRETIAFERYEKTEIKKLPVLKIFSGLETQKKLLDLIIRFAIKNIKFEMKDSLVISTIAFKVPGKAAAKELEPQAEKKAGPFNGKLRFAVHGTYFMMLDKNYKDTYVSLSGFGGSLAFRFLPKFDFWVSGGQAAKNNTPEWSPVELKFRMTPLSAAVRYYFAEKGKLSAFAGAGGNFFMVKDINPAGDIKTNIIGFNALAGGYYQLSRKIFAQLFLKFNLVQKDLYPDSDLDDPLNLSGLELNLGFGILL
jgi:hypothetical protein